MRLLALLAAVVPTLVHDAEERHPFEAVEPASAPVTAYHRRAAGWDQYWLWSPDNTQDRGVFRTGRHEGDWELVQVRDSIVVVSQHAGAERCRFSGPLTVYVAHGSHALYLRPGVRDRPWPDPNDEADGRGTRIVPAVEEIADQPWRDDARRWGRSRASWIPGEMDSPQGPAFQGIRWRDPAAFARTATSCRAERCDELGECDGRETAMTLGFAGLLVAIALVVRRRRVLSSP